MKFDNHHPSQSIMEEEESDEMSTNRKEEGAYDIVHVQRIEETEEDSGNSVDSKPLYFFHHEGSVQLKSEPSYCLALARVDRPQNNVILDLPRRVKMLLAQRIISTLLEDDHIHDEDHEYIEEFDMIQRLLIMSSNMSDTHKQKVVDMFYSFDTNRIKPDMDIPDTSSGFAGRGNYQGQPAPDLQFCCPREIHYTQDVKLQAGKDLVPVKTYQSDPCIKVDCVLTDNSDETIEDDSDCFDDCQYNRNLGSQARIWAGEENKLSLIKKVNLVGSLSSKEDRLSPSLSREHPVQQCDWDHGSQASDLQDTSRDLNSEGLQEYHDTNDLFREISQNMNGVNFEENKLQSIDTVAEEHVEDPYHVKLLDAILLSGAGSRMDCFMLGSCGRKVGIPAFLLGSIWPKFQSTLSSLDCCELSSPMAISFPDVKVETLEVIKDLVVFGKSENPDINIVAEVYKLVEDLALDMNIVSE